MVKLSKTINVFFARLTSGLSTKSVFNVKVILTLLAVVFVNNFVYTPLFFIISHNIFFSIINLLFLIPYSVVYILLKKQAVLKAKILIAAVFIIHISYACLCFPKGAGFHLYMLVVLPVSYVVFDGNEKVWKRLLIFIALILFFTFEIFQIEQFQISVSQLSQKIFYLGAVSSIIAGMTFMLQFYSSMLLAAERKQRELAITDSLTELYNRRYFYELAHKHHDLSKRHNTTFSIIMIDIDEFKKINDSFGHAAGDEVLKYFGVVLKKHFRSSDIIARYGGEEFICLLPHMPAEQSRSAAERLRHDVETSAQLYNKKSIAFTISLGISEYSDSSQSDTLEAVISRADKALLKAKASGKNKILIDKDL